MAAAAAVRVVCVGDTHGRHRERIGPPHGAVLPDGDVLLHAGDFTQHGDAHEVADFDEWLATLPHRHKVVVPGNHETGPAVWGAARTQALLQHATYLVDAVAVCDCGDGRVLRVLGVPWMPATPEAKKRLAAWAFDSLRVPGVTPLVLRGVRHLGVHVAFTLPRSPRSLGAAWASAVAEQQADEPHVLLTHAPSWGVLDDAWQPHDEEFRSWGCRVARACVLGDDACEWDSGGPANRRSTDAAPAPLAPPVRVRPLLHVFGHAHDSPGVALARVAERRIGFINASGVALGARPVVVDVDTHARTFAVVDDGL